MNGDPSLNPPVRQNYYLGLFLNGVRRRFSALVIALGMVIGFLPKDNLLALGLFLLLIFLPSRLILGFLSILVFTVLSIPVGFLGEILGAVLLQISFVQSLGSLLYAFPLGPWTMLNNTLVLGQFTIGLLLFIPVYTLSSRLLALCEPYVRFAGDSRTPTVEPIETETVHAVPVEHNTPGFFTPKPGTSGTGRFQLKNPEEV